MWLNLYRYRAIRIGAGSIPAASTKLFYMAIGFGSSLEEGSNEPYNRNYEHGKSEGYKEGFNDAILAAMKVVSQSDLIASHLTEDLYQDIRKLMKD